MEKKQMEQGPAERVIYKTGAVGISTFEPKDASQAIAVPLLPAELNAITLALISYRASLIDRIDNNVKEDLVSAIDSALLAVGDATGSRKAMVRDTSSQTASQEP